LIDDHPFVCLMCWAHFPYRKLLVRLIDRTAYCPQCGSDMVFSADGRVVHGEGSFPPGVTIQ
jgi:DNA-directed RNA polymerase subunit RPC12/RpoP